MKKRGYQKRMRSELLGLRLEHRESWGINPQTGELEGEISHINPRYARSMPKMRELMQASINMQLNWSICLNVHWKNKRGELVDSADIVAKGVKINDLTQYVKGQFAELERGIDPALVFDKSWTARPVL